MTNDVAKAEGAGSSAKRKQRKLSKGEKRLLLVSGAAMLLLASSVWLRALDSDPVIAPAPAPRPLPRPNAFDWFNKAGNALVKPRLLGDALNISKPGVRKTNGSTVRVLSLREKEALLRQNVPALSLLRRGLPLRYQQPRTLANRARSKYYALCRNLVRLLVLDAQIKAAHGDHAGAANSYLDALQLGIAVPRGGGSYAFLSGIACESMAHRFLWPALKKLNARESRLVMRRLQILESRRAPLADAFEHDKQAMQRDLMALFRRPDWRESLMNGYRNGLNMARFLSTMFGTPPPSTLDVWRDKAEDWRLQARLRLTSKRQVMNGYTQAMNAAIANCRRPYLMRRAVAPASPSIVDKTLFFPSLIEGPMFSEARIRARNALLLGTLALRAYRLERGSYPPSLDALTPTFLQRVPRDPFSAASFRYRRTKNSYTLYSIGPDGKDDGGKPARDKRYAGKGREYSVEADSQGDMVAGINQ